MLLPIRRPVRPEPLPLHERAGSASDALNSQVWLNVRAKRMRPTSLPARRSPSGRRGRYSAPRNKE
jgi:hypothetical protein